MPLLAHTLAIAQTNAQARCTLLNEIFTILGKSACLCIHIPYNCHCKCSQATAVKLIGQVSYTRELLIKLFLRLVRMLRCTCYVDCATVGAYGYMPQRLRVKSQCSLGPQVSWSAPWNGFPKGVGLSALHSCVTWW